MMKKWIALTICIATFLPIIIGVIVSVPSLSWLETANDWIGFWGGYAGAIIGGLITLLVLFETLMDNRKTWEKNRRQELCMRVANLVSNFCIEMMAYRSKWNTLHKKADGKEMDACSTIEYGATTEEPRRIYFELDILLKRIPEAKELLEELETTLNGKITKKTIKETEALMVRIREQTRLFIDKYSL